MNAAANKAYYGHAQQKLVTPCMRTVLSKQERKKDSLTNKNGKYENQVLSPSEIKRTGLSLEI